MKHANLYLSVLSLAVIGLSSYIAYGIFNPLPQPSVLGEETLQSAPKPTEPISPPRCAVGLKTFTLGEVCPLVKKVSKKTTNSAVAPTATPEASYYSAKFVCQDGSSGSIPVDGLKITSVGSGKCYQEAELKKAADTICKARSSCATKDYIPCAELQLTKGIFKCGEKPSTNTDAGRGCSKVNALIASYCPSFYTAPTPVACKRDPKLLGITTDKTCPSGQFKTVQYVCYDGSKGTVGDKNGPCQKSEEFRLLAEKACGSVGNCKTGKCSTGSVCITPKTTVIPVTTGIPVTTTMPAEDSGNTAPIPEINAE